MTVALESLRLCGSRADACEATSAAVAQIGGVLQRSSAAMQQWIEAKGVV